MAQEQDLDRIKPILKRRLWWFVLPFVSILVLTGVTCVVLPNTFKSTATVLILNQQIPSALVPSTVTTYALERIQSISQEVTSRARILKLAEKYALFIDKRKNWTTEDLVDAIRKRISFLPINTEINKESSSQPILLTIAFTLSYEDEDPKKTQAVTNEIVSYYLEKNLETREKGARGTTEFLTEQLNQEKRTMEELRVRMAAFQEENLESLPEFTPLNMQKLERLNLRISDINMQMRSQEEQRAVLKSNLALMDPYSGSGSKVMSRAEHLEMAKQDRMQLLSRYSEMHPAVLAKNQEIALLEAKAEKESGSSYKTIEKFLDLQGQLSELKSRYTSAHPAVQSTERELEQVQDELSVSLENKQPALDPKKIMANSSNPAYIGLQAEVEKISVAITSLNSEKAQLEAELKGTLEAKLQAMPKASKTFQEIDTDYQAAKVNFQVIQQKLMAAQVSQGMEENKKGESFQVVEPAFLPEKPFKPNRIIIMLLGTVFGMGLSLGAAALREFSDRKIYDSEAIEKISKIQVISLLPTIVIPEDAILKRKQRIALGIAGFCAIVTIVVAFHFFVMKLDVFHAKLTRLILRKIP